MKKSRAPVGIHLYTPRATLCALGLKVRSLKLFDTIAEHVRIRQKMIRHTPIEKLTDAFIAILAGAQGLCEVNRRAMASAYDEVVADRLYPGNLQLHDTLPHLVEALEPGDVLKLLGMALGAVKDAGAVMLADVLTVSGFLELGKGERVKRVVLNSGSAIRRACANALGLLLEAEHVRVTLGQT